jgi:hypothetical protein
MIRKMGEYDVIQRTRDGYFDANYLLRQWNQDGQNTPKRIAEFLQLKNTAKFIKAIADKETGKVQVPDCQGGEESVTLDNQQLSESRIVIRGRPKTLPDGSVVPGEVWMHPLLFIDFAMWINPVFKYDVLKFACDEMIRYRRDAGDAYRLLGSAIRRIVPLSFMQVAMQKMGEALNWIVFNTHEQGLRNKHGDEEKQRELFMLEKKIADLIDEGFLTSWEQVLGYARRLYQKKNLPGIFNEACKDHHTRDSAYDGDCCKSSNYEKLLKKIGL